MIDLLQDEMNRHPKDIMEDGLVNMVHTTGIFKHKVWWCQCPGASEKTVQFFQMQLFPASHLRP